MIYRTAITGTESTGKSTLAEELSIHFKTFFVPDYSRIYMERMKSAYVYEDVLKIAEGVIEMENKMLTNVNRMLFSDNDLINIKIWLQFYKWNVPEWLEKEILNRKNDLYLLCDIDIEWMPDELRQNPHNRVELFNLFVRELSLINANYKIITGKNGERTKKAIEVVDEFFASLDE